MSTTIRIERICEFCGNSFIAQTTVTKFCSHRCSSRAYKARKRAEKINTSNSATTQIRVKAVGDVSKREFLSIAEVCSLMGVVRQTVYNLIGRGELEASKFGGRTIIKRSNIDELLDKYSGTTKNDTAQNEFYTVKEIEKLYSIKYGRLYEIVKQNRMPKKLYKNRLYISKPHIDNYFLKVRGDITNIDEWYRVDELTEMFGVNRDTIYRIVSANSIPKKRVGRYVFISKWHFDNLELIEPPKPTIL